jgi:hypothetical protein
MLSRDRKLDKANLNIERLRFLFRLSTHQQYLDKRRYEHAARELDEIGRSKDGLSAEW